MKNFNSFIAEMHTSQQNQAVDNNMNMHGLGLLRGTIYYQKMQSQG